MCVFAIHRVLLGFFSIERSGYSQFKAYSQIVSASTSDDELADKAKAFFVEEKLIALNSRQNEQKIEGTLLTKGMFLRYPNKIARTSSIHEMHKYGKGCLVINGFNDKNEQTTIRIDYVRKNEIWLVDYVSIDYIFDGQHFVEKPICDAGRLNEIWLEWVQNKE